MFQKSKNTNRLIWFGFDTFKVGEGRVSLNRSVKETTQAEWFLLFYGGGSRSGSTRGVFSGNVTLFKFKRSLEITFIGPIFIPHPKQAEIPYPPKVE